MDTTDLGLVTGLVVDSSVLIQAERSRATTSDVIRKIRAAFGDVPVALSPITVAELGHGIYHTSTPEKAAHRRRFLDELVRHVPVHPISATTAEIVARVGGKQALRGITVPFSDLLIGACALELGYSVATHNVRHFRLIPELDVRTL